MGAWFQKLGGVLAAGCLLASMGVASCSTGSIQATLDAGEAEPSPEPEAAPADDGGALLDALPDANGDDGAWQDLPDESQAFEDAGLPQDLDQDGGVFTDQQDGDPQGQEQDAPQDAQDPAGSDEGTSADDTSAAHWRASLYPLDWTPGWKDAQGRFLHDFSWAGYKNSEEEPPQEPPGPIVDAVVDGGADPSGGADSTAAIQQAIDTISAAGGGVVYLPSGTYRLQGTLQVKASGVVLRGAGPENTRLVFTTGVGMSDKGHLNFVGKPVVVPGPAGQADRLLAVDGMNQAQVVELTDATGLTPGDDVSLGWSITDEFIAEHGMQGTWVSFNGQWKPFFRRQVLSVDTASVPHRVWLDVPLRYPARVRDGASLRQETGYLSGCGIEDLAVSNVASWSEAWAENRVHAIRLVGLKDGWVRNVHSFKSPWTSTGDHHLMSGGLKILDSKRLTVADCSMAKAQNRGGGGNGYLFEISRSSEILIRDCVGSRGRHNFIQNWDFGTSGCVFLRVQSEDSRAFVASWDPIGYQAYSEYHHSLAMANLVDASFLSDGWAGGNRGDESSGAGHSATQCAYWNLTGGGLVRSFQFGWGYLFGCEAVGHNTEGVDTLRLGTEPWDHVEISPDGCALEPASLFEDQRKRRLGLGP